MHPSVPFKSQKIFNPAKITYLIKPKISQIVFIAQLQKHSLPQNSIILIFEKQQPHKNPSKKKKKKKKKNPIELHRANPYKRGSSAASKSKNPRGLFPPVHNLK